jgi:hypothetical protein
MVRRDREILVSGLEMVWSFEDRGCEACFDMPIDVTLCQVSLSLFAVNRLRLTSDLTSVASRRLDYWL